MRVMLSSILRAVCAAAVGYLLVMYRDQMVQWITIAIGGMFLISGIISVLTYYRRHHARHDSVVSHRGHR